MTGALDFKKVKKTIKIFGVAQLGLVALLVFMAVNFQTKLRLEMREFRFLHGVLFSFAIQLLVLYPVYRFASKEADRDITMMDGHLTSEQLKEQTKKKRFADIIKIAVLGFFVVFVMAAPGDTFVLSIIYYSFILTILTYLQCYNFAARKIMREQGNA